MTVNITYRTSHSEAEIASNSFVNKNAPLSNKQIDGNFKSLKTAIESLQDAIGVGSTLSAQQIEFSPVNGIQSLNVQDAINEVNLIAIGKQSPLVSGDSIKTINGTSLLGSGNISITGGSVTGAVIDDTSTGTSETFSASEIISRLSDKQETLVNQTNIKSINGTSLLGSGNISIVAGTSGPTIDDSTTGTSAVWSSQKVSDVVSLLEPAIAKSTGYLTSDGTSWTFKNESYGVVNDNATGTTTWTSNKINSELASIASSSVSLTGTQTLSNKTLLSPTLTSYTETIHTITGTDIIAANGSIQTATLTGNVSYAITLGEGQSVTVLINPVTYTVSWTSAISWIGTTASSAPTLTASVMNCITFFKVGGVIYGKFSGRV